MSLHLNLALPSLQASSHLLLLTQDDIRLLTKAWPFRHFIMQLHQRLQGCFSELSVADCAGYAGRNAGPAPP